MWQGATHMTQQEADDASSALIDVLLKHRDGGETTGYYTKDNPELMTMDSHYVFVYGSLKAGFKRHTILQNQPVVGVGYTKFPMFSMYIYDKHINGKFIDRFPVLLFNTGSDKAFAYGEVYQVPTDTIRSLDFLEANGVYYKRTKVPCNIQTLQDGKVKVLSCWTYLGMKAHWSEKFNYLTRCDKLIAKKDSSFVYYNYMKRYENEISQ
jgi:gamma-glutamylcyclotransferase (GGCT)/AIG2-like uncharacterized protein YtfP